VRRTDNLVLSDPVHGFISVPRNIIFQLLETPHVQRLRRIRQLGVGYLIFPGAEHSRFTHAVGAMALMQDALCSLARSGTPISEEECQAAMAAALLHDIGHAPFSHTLEGHLIADASHEDITGALIASLIAQFGPPLDLALAMFSGTYDRSFFHELLSGQFDMDRMDYLRRDSHYTGVMEGRIGVGRILRTLCAHPHEGSRSARIAVTSKGTYAIENMLIARRLMYWQVYLHKTVVAGDQLLLAIFRRAHHRMTIAPHEVTSGIMPALRLFLERTPSKADLQDSRVLNAFLSLDDTDVFAALKVWVSGPDRILADLSRRFLERRLFRCTFLQTVPEASLQAEWREQVASMLCRQNLSTPSHAVADASYYLTVDSAEHTAYARDEGEILVLTSSGQLREISEVADLASIEALRTFVKKPYVCYAKESNLPV